MSLSKIIEWKLMNENLKPKVAIIMRGISGAGKSTKVRELLRKYGANVDHVFSADRQFHPVSNNLFKLDISKLTDQEAFKEANDILELWYNAAYSSLKKDYESAFLDFKKSFDSGDYRTALNIAKQMHGVLESVEYQENWHYTKISGAHKRTFSNFQGAVDSGITPVIVDNTNVSVSQMKPYVDYANNSGYEIIIQEPDSPHWKEYRSFLANKYQNRDKISEFAQILADKNSHGVPLNTIEKMLAQWDHNVTVKDILKSK